MHTADIASGLFTQIMAFASMVSFAVLVRAISQDFDVRFGAFVSDASTNARHVARLRLSIEPLAILTAVSGLWYLAGFSGATHASYLFMPSKRWRAHCSSSLMRIGSSIAVAQLPIPIQVRVGSFSFVPNIQENHHDTYAYYCPGPVARGLLKR